MDSKSRKPMYGDALCFVLANDRKKETVYAVLNKYIPGYEQISGDYGFGSTDKEFANEDEILTFLETNQNETGVFHWNKDYDNPDRIMVGAYFKKDNSLVMSLTLPGDDTKEVIYLEDLKHTLNSDTGVIYYNCLPRFDSGEDFKDQFGPQPDDFLTRMLKKIGL